MSDNPISERIKRLLDANESDDGISEHHICSDKVVPEGITAIIKLPIEDIAKHAVECYDIIQANMGDRPRAICAAAFLSATCSALINIGLTVPEEDIAEMQQAIHLKLAENGHV